MNLLLKPNKYDALIGSFLLLLIFSLIISLFSLNNSSSSDDHYVYIKYRNELVYQMNLEHDEVFTLYQNDEKYHDLLGDFEITVKNGKVGITNNTCPEEYCKHIGWINSRGYSIICAPNNVVIEIGSKVNNDCDWGACLQ